MGLDLYSRRKYRHKKFVYLLDDEEKTAWIAQGHIGRGKRYRIPEFVIVDGERYSIESMEIGDCCFAGCPNLRDVVLPEGFEKLMIQSFMENPGLRHVDLPSTLTELGWENFVDCPNLETVILRSPKKLEFNRNFGAHFQSLPMKDPCLYVPAELVGQYREDPEWQMFKRILPI
ncbi:MAG: leucine-rich repeat domain-containing protein [Bacteroidales bacterium]|nr:leucine-rich repeat domain-containing protein [Bacteroidales bacterium]